MTMQMLHVIFLVSTPIDRWQSAGSRFKSSSAANGLLVAILIVLVIAVCWLCARQIHSTHRRKQKSGKLTNTNEELQPESDELGNTNEESPQESNELGNTNEELPQESNELGNTNEESQQESTELSHTNETNRGQELQMRILVAEDDPPSRNILQKRLESWGHEVVVTKDGKQAWDAIQRESPDIAILDWMMPELSGIDVCRNIRNAENLPYIYTIILTAKGQTKDMLASFDAGADAFMVKPADKDILRSHIDVGSRIVGRVTAREQ